jgi:hypothetical protein
MCPRVVVAMQQRRRVDDEQELAVAGVGWRHRDQRQSKAPNAEAPGHMVPGA